MRVEIRLLGGFVVLVDGARLPDDAWSRTAPATLVKLLALAPGHRLRREQVIDALWPDLLVDRAAPRLHKAAHYARSALGAADGVVLSADSVALLPTAEVVVDVAEFEAAAASNRVGEAVELYRGELLPDDVYEPWTEADRDRLRLAHQEMLHALGRWDALIAADPLDEVAHLRLVQEHVQRGDRRAALRQLEEMEKLWQRELGEELVGAALTLREEAEALPVELAPVQPARVRVPSPATHTVGRDRDIERVGELLDSERTVTLLGPGGVGKTRLAIEVALRRTEESAYVDLTKVGASEHVPGLVARELGIHVEAEADVVEALAEALRNRGLLLILDNVEHVIEAVGIVPRLVERSPGLHVLTTSRARLRVPGEQVYDVLPLSLETSDVEGGRPDAIMLFDQAARAVDPDFEVDRHLADVVTICRAVDCLPLAIELAAGHVRTLSPPLLRARLSQRLGSASGASRGAPERQQTVPAMIDWSLRLLGEEERDLFVLLGVFHGPVPLEIVEQVCARPGGDVVEALSRLVDHSLVRRLDDGRFLLLELMRERSRALLAEDPELDREVRRRHAAYLADWLDDLDERRWGEASGTWIDDITRLLADIRAAHDWTSRTDAFEVEARITAGLGTYWHREGSHPEGRGWAAASLAHESELDDFLVGRLYLAAGFVEWTRDRDVGRRHWRAAEERFRELGHDRYLAYALALISTTYVGDRDSTTVALEICDEAIALARQVGERPLLAQALNILGELTRVSGDDERALAAYDEGLELARAAGDRTHEAMLVGNLSFIAEHRGDFEEALRLCAEAVRLSWALGRRLVLAATMAQMGGANLGLGRPERGAVLMGAAAETMRRIGVDASPGDTPELDRVEAALRAELGPERLEALLAEGARLSLDEAVVMALEDTD